MSLIFVVAATDICLCIDCLSTACSAAEGTDLLLGLVLCHPCHKTRINIGQIAACTDSGSALPPVPVPAMLAPSTSLAIKVYAVRLLRYWFFDVLRFFFFSVAPSWCLPPAAASLRKFYNVAESAGGILTAILQHAQCKSLVHMQSSP